MNISDLKWWCGCRPWAPFATDNGNRLRDAKTKSKTTTGQKHEKEVEAKKKYKEKKTRKAKKDIGHRN